MGRVWGIELLLPYTTSWLAGQSPFYHHRARSSGRGRASLVTSRVHLAGPLVRGPCFEKHGSQAKGRTSLPKTMDQDMLSKCSREMCIEAE